MHLAIIVPFRDERQHLSAMLESLGRQERAPDAVILVDDGSVDGSRAVAQDFAADRSNAQVVGHHACPGGPLHAPALRAFAFGTRHLDSSWDAVAKLDADLVLPPDFLAELERRLESDPHLGIVGAHLAEWDASGALRRMPCPTGHVQGATKLYRRACMESIAPLPDTWGWDTVDEFRARQAGWRTRTFALPSGDVVHLRPMGSKQGLLRGHRRAGAAAWGYGAGPVQAAVSAVARTPRRPAILAGVHFLAGYVQAAGHRSPRADRAIRAEVRRHFTARLRRAVGGTR